MYFMKKGKNQSQAMHSVLPHIVYLLFLDMFITFLKHSQIYHSNPIAIDNITLQLFS